MLISLSPPPQCSWVPSRIPHTYFSCLLNLLWSVIISQTFLVLDDINSFKEQNVPQLGMSDVFLMVKLRLLVWGAGADHRLRYQFYPIISSMPIIISGLLLMMLTLVT